MSAPGGRQHDVRRLDRTRHSISQGTGDKEHGPISPGEVQLRELEYELKLKQAELEDAKERRAQEIQVRNLELQLEQQRAKTAESQLT